jgi:hypothetical protein
MRQAMVAGMAAAMLSLAGCSAFTVPSTTTTTTTPTTAARTTRAPASAAVATANRTHEYPGPPPPAEHASGSPTAQAAVYAYATGYINWNAGNVVADLTQLGRDSVGQARAAMQIEAAGIASDYELRGGRIANSGTVEAVAPLRGRPDGFVVVTRESTSSATSNTYQGLRPEWHVTVATVRRAGPGRWVVSGWQPES